MEYVRALTQAEEVAQHAYVLTQLALGSKHRTHYYNTPNAYLDTITTQEDLQPAVYEQLPYQYFDDKRLHSFRFP